MTTADGDLIVLLAVRLAGRAPIRAVEAVVEHLGGIAGESAGRLQAAIDRGRVRVRGEDRRHSLTPAGREELAAGLAAATDAAGRAELIAAYEAFLPLNRAFLAALRSPPTPERLATLTRLVSELEPVLAAVTHRLGRFAAYEGRLARALEEAVSDPAWIESPALDSIHTVWFELHEHLLATLGRDRTAER